MNVRDETKAVEELTVNTVPRWQTTFGCDVSDVISDLKHRADDARDGS
jgi:hypothetical protein